MDLSEDQCQEFEDRGWLVVGDVFSEKELDLLTNAALVFTMPHFSVRLDEGLC